MASAVVISDTHFGLGSSTLADKELVDSLVWEIWKYGHGCNEVVLLGDIFDFWRAKPEKAIRDSRYFLKRLDDLDLSIRYVVGNHDHHMVVMNQESEFLEKIAHGDAYSVYIPNLRWSRTINGLMIDMFYPTYTTRCYNKDFLFTHGHHLVGIQAFSIQVVERLRRISGEQLSPADLEMMMTYAYESIYRSSYIGEMAEVGERLWKASSIFNKMRTSILKTFRSTPVDRHYEAIMKFIRDRMVGRVDCFVYGDTHRPGIYKRNGGPLAVNTGSFTHEDEGGSISNKKEIPNTYMIIGKEGLTVRQLGRQNPLFICDSI